MTLASFRSLTHAMARTEGNPYLKPADVELFNDLVQEMLDVYCSQTHCLQADDVAFTPIAGYASYDTGKTYITIDGVATTYLTYRMCDVRQVVVNGAYLQSFNDIYGRPGPSSEYDMAQGNRGYLLSSSGQPAFWWQEPPNTLRFDKAFDQSYSNCFVAGRRYHSLFTANDAAEIELAAEDIEPAAMLAASRLLRPNSLEKATAMRTLADAQMKERKKVCGAKLAGSSRRGTPEPTRGANMVFGGGSGYGSPRRYRS